MPLRTAPPLPLLTASFSSRTLSVPSALTYFSCARGAEQGLASEGARGREPARPAHTHLHETRSVVLRAVVDDDDFPGKSWRAATETGLYSASLLYLLRPTLATHAFAVALRYANISSIIRLTEFEDARVLTGMSGRWRGSYEQTSTHFAFPPCTPGR